MNASAVDPGVTFHVESISAWGILYRAYLIR